jgi:hypothetical protein
MASVTDQKRQARELICEGVQAKLELHPERAITLALNYAGNLVSRMTLEELEEWRDLLYVKGYISNAG